MKSRGKYAAAIAGLLIIIVSATPMVAGQGCEAMSEVWKQVRLRLTATARQTDLEQAEQQLRSITSNCPDDGDAWYYLSLVRRQLKRPAQDIAYARRKAEEFDSKALKEGLDPFSPAGQPTTSPPGPAAADRTPPKIRITSPEVSRGQGVSVGRYRLVGEASDESGVSEVLVNDKPAALEADGKFTAEVLLKVGQNPVTIKATDIKGNTATETVTITRQPDATRAPAGDEGTTVPAAGRYYALLIAVQDYQDKSIPQLQYPVKDAERVSETLTKYYSFDAKDVALLKNPDREAIYRALDALAKKLTANDSLFIFYAGHGQYEESVDQGFWLPSNAAHDVRSGWISNGDLRDNLRAIKAQHILLVTDSCFSGALVLERSVPAGAPPAIERLAMMKSRKALTSGAKETVPDKSVFVTYLIQMLEENKKSFLTALDLYQNIREPVINNSPKQQAPMHAPISQVGDAGGDFIFVRRK